MSGKTSAIALFLAAVLWWPPEIYSETRGLALAFVFGAAAWAALRHGDCPPVAFWAVAGLLFLNAAFTASHRTAALEQALFFCACFLAGWLAWLMPMEQRGTVLGAWLWMALALSLYGFYQSVWGMEAMLSRLPAAGLEDVMEEAVRERLVGSRVFSRFALPTTFGGFLAMTLPLALPWLASPRRGRRLGAAVLILLMAGNMLLAGSLGAVLAFGAALAAAALCAGRERIAASLSFRVRLALVAALALVLLGAAAFRAGDWRTWSEWNHPVMARLANWNVAWKLWREKPLAGHGLASYGTEYTRFRTAQMNETQFAHNSYLQLAAETGLAGLALLGWLLWRWARGFGRNREWQTMALEAGCLAFILHNVIDFTLYTHASALLFAVGMGFLMRCRSGGTANAAPLSTGRRPAAVSAAVLMVMLAVVPFLHNSALQLEEARGLAAEGKHREAVQRLEASRRWWPWRPETDILEVQIILRQGAARADLARARRLAERAIALNPHLPYPHAVLAQILLLQNDPRGALREMEEAQRLYPAKTLYARQAAQIRQRMPPDS